MSHSDREAQRKLLVTDFDGTLTRRDFFQLVVEAYAPEALAEFWDGYRAGRYSHFEALEGIFGCIRGSEADLLRVVVHANPGRFEEGKGLVLQLPESSPYFARATGIDKAAIVRAGLEAGRVVAFAGDGLTDAEAARLVAADLRFARGELARVLACEGLPYRPFERWAEVAGGLLEAKG